MSRKKCNRCGYERMTHDVWIEEKYNVCGGYSISLCAQCKEKHDAEMKAKLNELRDTDKRDGQYYN